MLAWHCLCAELSLTEHSDSRHRERRRIGRPAGGGGPRAAKGTAPNLSTVCASDTNSSMAASPLSHAWRERESVRGCTARAVRGGAGDLGGIRQDRAWVEKSQAAMLARRTQRELAVSGGHGTGSSVSGGSIYPTHAVARAAHARGRRTVGGGRALRERQPHAEPLPTRPARSCSGNAMRQRISRTARMPMHTPAESLHRCPPTAR